MKRIFIVFVCLLIITSCQENNDSSIKLYNEMIEILDSTEDFVPNSKYFTVSYEVATTNEGQRYYIVIDNPTMAMYGVNVLAFEEGSDIENEFAPNAGIFENKINLVPNQINKDMGFVKGISISGILSNDSPVFCLVQWKDEKNSKFYREFLKFSKS